MIDIFELGQEFKKILNKKRIDSELVLERLKFSKDILREYLNICIIYNIDFNREIIKLMINFDENDIKKYFLLGIYDEAKISNEDKIFYKTLDEKLIY